MHEYKLIEEQDVKSNEELIDSINAAAKEGFSVISVTTCVEDNYMRVLMERSVINMEEYGCTPRE